MKDFPEFMRNKANLIPYGPQDDKNVAGYFYRGDGGGQMAFWTCHSAHASKKHTHDFDEYMICVAGEYRAFLGDKEHLMKPGDELYIPRGTEHWEICAAGTRTIHAFGGERIKC
jgi:mannose-6-phosphate isomerase-like protein (cupin superfamily)